MKDHTINTPSKERAEMLAHLHIMANVEIKLNLKGINEMMKSDGMQSALLNAGNAVASAAGTDYAAEVHQATYVAISNVYPDSERAAHENYTDNTLLQAVGAVGLPTSKPRL